MARPSARFQDFIGQKKIIGPLRRELAGAIALAEPMPHSLFRGPSGVGKTRLARALAAERGTNFVRVVGDVSRRKLAKKLRALEECDFLFLDEAHNLRPATQEMLFEAIDRRKILVPGVKGQKGAEQKAKFCRIKPFTLILATDRPGALLGALRGRIANEVFIPPYPLAEMREIVATVAAARRVLLSPQATTRLAKVCRGIPRKAEHFLYRLRCHYPGAQHQINLAEVQKFLREVGIDRHGLGPVERKYLRALAKRETETLSLTTLALLLGTDRDEVQYQIEAPLVRRRLVVITGSGRKLTEKGRALVSKVRRNPQTDEEGSS